MVSPNPRIKFTYQDYKNAPEDKRYELLDGDLVMVPAPRTYHQKILRDMGTALWDFVRTRNLGQVFYAPVDVVLTNTDVVQPDLLFVSNERVSIITEDNIQGAPDLVIEILSPSSAERDRTFKRSLYSRHRVKEYWIVDPDTKTIEVLIAGEDGLELAASFTSNETLSSPFLPELTLPLSQIF